MRIYCTVYWTCVYVCICVHIYVCMSVYTKSFLECLFNHRSIVSKHELVTFVEDFNVLMLTACKFVDL